eukprot:scaffold392334_cov36-Prasinocladus_malaysianus.AAC.1
MRQAGGKRQIESGRWLVVGCYSSAMLPHLGGRLLFGVCFVASIPSGGWCVVSAVAPVAAEQLQRHPNPHMPHVLVNGVRDLAA